MYLDDVLSLLTWILTGVLIVGSIALLFLRFGG